MTAYDSPIYIADAALYLMTPSPSSASRTPTRWTQNQLDAAVDLLKEQNENIGEYWSDYLKEIQAFKTGDSTVIGTTWQVIANLAQAEKAAGRGRAAQGGLDRLVGHLDGRPKSQHQNCAYKWMDQIVSPEGQRPGRRVVR